MRCLLLLILPLAACAPEAEPVDQVWADGRDALCLAGKPGSQRAGLVTYGRGDSNCTLTGTVGGSPDRLTIAATGDPACTVEVIVEGDRAVVGDRSKACAYYCGPGADFAGRMLERSTRKAVSVTDFAGERLC